MSQCFNITTSNYSKKFLFRFFPKAPKYFDLGMIMIIIPLFWCIMYQKVRGSRNRSICRRAAAIVSKWPQDECTCGITKNMQYVHTYGTQKRPMRFFFYFKYAKNSRCYITHLKCSISYYIPQRIFMSIWNEVTSR